MRKSHVLAKLASDQPAWCLSLSMSDFTVYELASLAGIDGIWMDLEHHGHSVETASQLMCAARVGDADIVARPGKGEFMRMGRLLEMGATGIMYPRCDDAAEAKEVVRWSKFAPLGVRGYDGSNPDMPYMSLSHSDYLREANEQTFVIIQLEHQSAVDQAESIAAVAGVNFLMLGPSDFSILSGIPGDFEHPKVQAAINSISQAAKNTGKSWAALCISIEQVRNCVSAGAGLIFYFSGISALKAGILAARESILSEGFPLRASTIQ